MVWLWWAMGAWAADPLPPVDIRAWTVARYNDHLVETAKRHVLRFIETGARFGALDTDEAFEAYRAELSRQTRESTAQVVAVPPWHGDAAFRDALLESLDWVQDTVDRIYPEIWALAGKEEVTNADLARLEALYGEIHEAGARVQARVEEAQRAFAQRNRARLVPEPPIQWPQVPEFVAPRLPPPGSRVPGATHVAFAIRYHNQVLATRERLVDAMNTFFRADPPERRDAHARALELLQAERERVAAVEDWQGDPGLADALRGYAAAVDTALSRSAPVLLEIAKKNGKIAPDSVAPYNRLVESMNRALGDADEAFRRAEDAFRSQWYFDDYEEWRAGLAVGAPG